LNVFPITIPPLRERVEDILPLALDFVQQFGVMAGKRFTEIDPQLRQRLIEHPWTGNVRELRNLMERAAILENGPVLTGRSLPLDTVVHRAMATAEEIVPLDEIEYVMVQRALRASHGNQSQAARLLQVSRDQLRYRVKRYREMGRELVADDV
jgi:DNA-binding NtrC family response regulator